MVMLNKTLFKMWINVAGALSCAAFLTACGGSGDKPSTASSAPSLSSASSLSISSSLSSSSSVSSSSSLSSASKSSSSSSLSISSSLSSFSSSSSTAKLMGGTIQGTPLNIAGVVTTLAGAPYGADGIGLGARFYAPKGTVSDGTNLYVTDSQNNKIRKIVIATGVVTTLAGSGAEGAEDGTGTAASFYYPQGITSDSTNLYVADTYNHKIRKIVIATGVVTTLAGSDFVSADDTGTMEYFSNPTGITRNGTNLYVTDTLNNKIRKIEIATGVVTTLAGSGSPGSEDGTGTAASFNFPEGITSDDTNLYITDTQNHKIRKIVIATGVVTTLAGSDSYGSEDGTGTAASFYYPEGITSDDTNLYVADPQNNKIRKIEIATGVVTTLAGSGSPGSEDGTGTAASFSTPGGITSDGTNLFVADTSNNIIRKIVMATGAVSTLAGSNSLERADGIGTAASFISPGGITSDGTNLYVTDTQNHKIRKIVIATGVVTTLAGSHSNGYADGTGTAAEFNSPIGITSDGANLYVADSGNNEIRKIVIATGAVTTLAGSGAAGAEDGTGTAASFSYPHGITSDGTNLYVADTFNHKIRKIVIATGAVTTLAGSGAAGAEDGTGTAASFYYPHGITSDGTNLYVADTFNHKIRKIVIATGAVTTLAGSSSYGNVDGTGTAASFSFPEDITSDGTNLYVSDYNKIRKIVITTGVVTTLAGSDSEGSADGTGTAAEFNSPIGITSNGFDLFVVDTGNNTIRRIH